MRETVTVTGIVRDYLVRNIEPDEKHQVNQGVLEIWIWCNLFVCRLVIGDVEMTSQYAYRNTTNRQKIADDIYGNDGDLAVGQINLSTAASILGRKGGEVTSEAKTLANRDPSKANKPPKEGKLPRGRQLGSKNKSKDESAN